MAKIEITRVPEEDLTIFNVRGSLSAEEIIEYSKEHYMDNPTQLVMWDITNGSISEIDVEEFGKISTAVKPYTEKRAGGKTAFVGSVDADFGMGRMYESYAEVEKLPIQYRTFRNRDEAMSWLLGG